MEELSPQGHRHGSPKGHQQDEEGQKAVHGSLPGRMVEFTVEPVNDYHLLKGLADLQLETWGFDPVEVVPAHVLHAASKECGQVLAALTPGGEAVAFTLGFFSKDRDTGKDYLLSHMLAVKPGLQSRSLGYQMKLAQRDEALKLGIKEVRWTYDPLLTKNANLNIRKLGARVVQFEENKYGEVKSDLYGHLPTDRFVVSWDLKNPSPAYFPPGGEIVLSATVDNKPIMNEASLGTDSSLYIMQVPLNHEQLRKSDMVAAAQWQTSVREISQRLLGHQYAIVGFRVLEGKEVGEYLFERK